MSQLIVKVTEMGQLLKQFSALQNFKLLLSGLVLSLLLSACSSETDTISNLDTGGGGSSNYSGPTAATDDVRAFQQTVWESLRPANRCGQCHSSDTDIDQSPGFADNTDVNFAFAQVASVVDLQDPANSRLVTKVGSGHNCWLTDNTACADIIETLIIAWNGEDTSSSVRLIQLSAPTIKDPGDSKNFPDMADDNGADSFKDTIHPLLTQFCAECHDDTSATPIAPFFANSDVDAAYESAKAKLDIDTPSNSRFVLRLREEFHNCWTNNCLSDADDMQTQIEQFAGVIIPTTIDADLITSKALLLEDGIIASGGSRHEANLIALWEFKTGLGSTAFDTSGIEPAINLNFTGSVSWVGGNGLDFTGGQARGDTGPSKKLNDFIRSSGEYAVEAWIIPSNVSQEDAHIISYSAGSTLRNFTLAQQLYNYLYFNRSTFPSADQANGNPFLSTEDAGEILQSSLQHVVTNYDPINGRQVYVNGVLINVQDPVDESSSINNWDDSYAFVLGNEVSGNRPWSGKLRLVAIHNRQLTQAQVTQNFDVGVGEKFFLLFSISEQIGVADSYIMFEVSQFDSFSYLFNKPTFINLDPNFTPTGTVIKGLRIAVNGKQVVAGQSFANMDTTVNSSEYDSATGQLLSTLGAVISLEKGSDKGANSDEFFLTFENLDGNINAFSDPPAVVPLPPATDADLVADIGVKNFDEINATISAITGIAVTNSAISTVFDQYKQQLPTVENIDGFLPAHQMAIAQLALTSCSELVEADILLTPAQQYFTGFDFTQSAGTAFDSTPKRDAVINPLLEAAMNVDLAVPANNLDSQPDATEISDLLGSTAKQDLDAALNGDAYDSLITLMTTGAPNTTARTAEIVKAVCAAITGASVMLVQ